MNSDKTDEPIHGAIFGAAIYDEEGELEGKLEIEGLKAIVMNVNKMAIILGSGSFMPVCFELINTLQPGQFKLIDVASVGSNQTKLKDGSLITSVVINEGLLKDSYYLIQSSFDKEGNKMSISDLMRHYSK